MIPNLGYIDMGLKSDLALAHDLMPDARRALMYGPMDLTNKSIRQLEDDIRRIVRDFAPCDMVVADIDKDVADETVVAFLKVCQQYN